MRFFQNGFGLQALGFSKRTQRTFLNNSRNVHLRASPRRINVRLITTRIHYSPRNPFSMLQLMTGGTFTIRNFILPRDLRDPRKLADCEK